MFLYFERSSGVRSHQDPCLSGFQQGLDEGIRVLGPCGFRFSGLRGLGGGGVLVWGLRFGVRVWDFAGLSTQRFCTRYLHQSFFKAAFVGCLGFDWSRV